MYAEFDAHVKKLTNDDIDKERLGVFPTIKKYYEEKISEIKKDKRKEKKTLKDQEDQHLIIQKQEDRQAKKLKIPPMGVRRAMNVCNKPEFKKKKVKKITRIPENLEFAEYMGESFTVMKEAAD